MKRLGILAIALCVSSLSDAQSNDDFESFRQGMMSNFQSFRKKVLDDYASYLDGIWKEYKSFKGEKRDEFPKPTALPIVKDIKLPPIVLPTPAPVSIPVMPTPEPIPVPKVPMHDRDKDFPTPSIPKGIPDNAKDKPVTPVSTVPSVQYAQIEFYGQHLKLVQSHISSVSENTTKAAAKAWREYQGQSMDNVISSIASTSKTLNLNDYLKFELVSSYVNLSHRNSNKSSRVILRHFLLTHLGYDVRLGMTSNEFILLVPFKEMVYARSYITINNTRYYVFDDSQGASDYANRSIYSCQIPTHIDMGNELSAVAESLNISSGAFTRKTLTDGTLTITGEVNNSMMEMLRHYPQLDIPAYASSNLAPAFRKDILRQLESQIRGLSQREAVAKLLHFTQYAFQYATDGEQHGYEKAYFFEENFYYPKNDCEDRAIFFAYLVRRLLGLDVHLIQFPGHECTAIHFTDPNINGDNYSYNGQKYIICDPTYIGASIGMCMPQYRGTQPKIRIIHCYQSQ